MPPSGTKRKQKQRKRGQVQVKVAPPVPSRRSANYAQAVGNLRNRPRRGASKGSGGNRTGRRFPSGAATRGRRTTRICEDEYVAEVAGSTGFATAQYPINPGQALTFPWLSKEALLWEKYHFEQLEFYYRPEVSAFATNGQAGKVMLSCDYDASDAPPATKQQVEDTHPHQDAMPYEDVYLRLEPNEMYQSSDAKYVRPGGLPGGSDIKTYDCGNLFVSTIGNTNTTTIGELRVRYCVVFDVPVLENTAGAPQNNQVAQFRDNTPSVMVSATPFQYLMPVVDTNGISAVNTVGSIVLPAGNYQADFRDTVTAATDMVVHLLQFEKNGVVVAPTPSRDISAGAALSVDSHSGHTFFTANGTDAFTLVGTVTGTGAITGAGFLTISTV